MAPTALATRQEPWPALARCCGPAVLIHHKPLAVFSAAVLGGLAAAMIGLTLVSGWLGISLAFFALRFFGQGLSTHAAMTAMGRYFSAELGHDLG